MKSVFNRHLTPVIFWLLYFGALVFPFSVAATNAAFGTAILLSFFSGHFSHGTRFMQRRWPYLFYAIIAYLILMLLGLSWSKDINHGLIVISHQWLWLLLPIFISISLDQSQRNKLLLFLSIGLTLHLFYCVLQKFGLVAPPNVGGSNIDDATGYIGHIGFGFVYAIWGGWLLQRGWLEQGWIRWGCWLLSAWAFMMIFLAQGRSGYLVAIAILLIILWKHAISEFGWKRSMLAISVCLIALLILAAGPGKTRIQKTWESASAAFHGDLKHAETRWIIWFGTLKTLEASPVFGVGTGGFPATYLKTIKQYPEFVHRGGKNFHHPHNIYLQSLVRWSAFGLIIIVMLLATWLRTGWKLWAKEPEASLVLLSGIAVLVHGFSAASLEEHFPAVMAIIMLGIGLGDGLPTRKSLSG